MKTTEVLEKLESIIKNYLQENNDLQTIDNEQPDKKEEGEENNSNDKNIIERKKSKNPISEILLLLVSFFLEILKSPFKLVAKYLKSEMLDAIKKDLMNYAILMFLMGVMFVFFSVLWLTIAIAVGVYFFKEGNTIYISVIYSLLFQMIVFFFIAIIAFFSMRQIKSIKLIRKISKL